MRDFCFNGRRRSQKDDVEVGLDDNVRNCVRPILEAVRSAQEIATGAGELEADGAAVMQSDGDAAEADETGGEKLMQHLSPRISGGAPRIAVVAVEDCVLLTGRRFGQLEQRVIPARGVVEKVADGDEGV